MPLGLVVSLAAAMLLNRKMKTTSLFRTFFYLPVLCSSVATATIWYWLLNPQYGLLNQLLGLIGINGPAWLYSSNWAMTAIVIMSVWMSFGGKHDDFLGGFTRDQSCSFMKQQILKAQMRGKNLRVSLGPNYPKQHS